jgi:hypothetical protein
MTTMHTNKAGSQRAVLLLITQTSMWRASAAHTCGRRRPPTHHPHLIPDCNRSLLHKHTLLAARQTPAI